VADIDWFSARNAEWIEAYGILDEAPEATGATSFVDELRGALELGHDGDAAVYAIANFETAAASGFERRFTPRATP
jgi:hypothetical protein